MLRRLSRGPSASAAKKDVPALPPPFLESMCWASTLEDALPTLTLCVTLLSAVARSASSREGEEEGEALQLAARFISGVYQTFLSTPEKRARIPTTAVAETQFSAFLSHYWENKDDVDPLYKALTAVSGENKPPVFYDAAGHIGNLSALPWRIAQSETYVPIIGQPAGRNNAFDMFARPACLVEMITAYRLRKPIFVVILCKPGLPQAEFPTPDQLKSALSNEETRTLGKNIGLNPSSLEEILAEAMKAIQWVREASLSQTTSIRWHRGTESQQAELISIARTLRVIAAEDQDDRVLSKKMGFFQLDDVANPAGRGGTGAVIFVLGASDVRPEIATNLQEATKREFPESTTRIVPITTGHSSWFYSSSAKEKTLVVMLSPKLLTEELPLSCVVHAYKTNTRWVPVLVDEVIFDFRASIPAGQTADAVRSLLKEVSTITLTSAKKPDLYRMNMQRLWSKLEFDVFREFPLLPNVDNKYGSFVQKAREFVPETRTWVFQQVEDWITSASSGFSNSFLIVGNAGLGKSVIAGEIARRGSPIIAAQVAAESSSSSFQLLKDADVVAVHAFRHDDAQLSSGLACIGSLARQIAASDDIFRAELMSFLAKRDDSSMRNIKSLLKYALVEPASKASAEPRRRMRLIVLDALDECADREELLDALVESWSSLANQGWGLLMTSRDDDGSKAKMDELNPHPLRQDEEANLEDIARYAKMKLANCFTGGPSNDLDAAAELIRDNSEGVFLYASLTVTSLLESNHRVTLADIQRLPPGLYSVFCDYFGRVRSALGSAQTFRRVLSPILAAREPLPVAVWREASGFTTSDCAYCLSPAKSHTTSEAEREFREKVVAPMSRLLNITGSVTLGHKSMRDFLLESEDARKKGLDVSELDGHDAMARTANQAYVRDIEKNAQWCKPWYRLREEEEGWEMTLDLRFLLSHGAYHAVRANRADLVLNWFTELQRVYWMAGAANRDVSKLERLLTDVGSAVSTLVTNDRGEGALGKESEDGVHLRMLELIAEVLHMCASTALAHDPRELAGQVLGRMGLLDDMFVPSRGKNALQSDRIDDQARAQWKAAAEEWYRRAASEGRLRVAKPTPRCGLSVVGVPLKRIFAGHSRGVESAVFSPDGKMILTGSWDETARLWDVASGRELKKFEGHSDRVTSAVFSPDGKMILTGSVDNTARLWDVASGRELKKFEGHSDRVISAVFSPDGKMILTGSYDATARLWDVASGRELKKFEGHSDRVTSAVFSPAGKMILTGSWDETARLWDVASGRELKKFEGHSDRVTSAVFSPDGKMILTSADKIARLWDAASGRELKKFEGHSDEVTSAVFSPDGKMILTGSDDKTARLWDVAFGRELKKFEGHSDEVSSAVFSPDGKMILTGSDDKTARLWDVASGRELKKFEGHSNGVRSAVFSPDGKMILTGSDDKTARLWDVASGRELKRFEGHSFSVNSAVFSPDGKMILTGSFDKTARLWDVASGRELKRFEGHSWNVNSAVFSPDGKMILTGSWDNTARLWDVASGRELKKFEGHSDRVTSAVFSPDGKMVLTGSWDKTARLWDVASGRELKKFEGHSDHVLSAVFSPDGKMILTGSWDKTARLWDVASGRELKKFEGHSDHVMSAVFSPDGKMILTGSHDNTAQLWDVTSGRELKKFEGHSGRVTSAVFSPDGKMILTGSWDKTARLWDVASGRELKRFEGHSRGVESAVFSPDGKMILTGSDDNTARLWDVASGRELKKFQDGVLSEVYAPMFDKVTSGVRGSRHVVFPSANVSCTLDEILRWECNDRIAKGPHDSSGSYFTWTCPDATIAIH